jgi:transposase
MKLTRIGLDLAKNVLQVHGVDRTKRVVVRRQLSRNQVEKFFEKLALCLIGREA